jgi:hypothetical protein
MYRLSTDFYPGLKGATANLFFAWNEGALTNGEKAVVIAGSSGCVPDVTLAAIASTG